MMLLGDNGIFFLLTMVYFATISTVLTLPNVARNGTATQSSTNYYGDFYWNASLAIDGDKSGRDHIDYYPTCSGTDNQLNPWWRVDLHREHVIQTVKVYGRLMTNSGQLRGFRLYITSRDPDEISSADRVYTDNISEDTYWANNGIYLLSVNQIRLGRYVHIVLPKDKMHLIICEVEVYGCPSYFYGNDCTEKCGDCNDSNPCRSSDGFCYDGCIPGYQPSLCQDACPPSKYGDSCRFHCGHCKDSLPCDRVDGRCSSCAAGYRGTTCSENCGSYSYGENCSSICGHCRNGQSCNHITGACNECENGFDFNMDTSCNTACIDGHYGNKCEETCGNCRDGSVCNKTKGYCDSGCAPGYRGSRCNAVCTDKTFGEDCRMTCHCKNDAQCNFITGACPGACAFGWGGHDCNTDLNLIQRLGPETLSTDMATPIYAGMNSSLAVDGNDSPDVYSCQCCSVSKAADPWWTLDLHRIYPIQRVIFVGRSGYHGCGQFSGFRLYLSNASNAFSKPFYTDNAPCWSWTTTFIVPIAVPNMLVRFLKIDRDGDIFTMCELKVYEGECTVGRFGEECAKECHCSDSFQCARETGLCRNAGCFSGWQGAACDKECTDGSFGVNCTGVCHCLDNDSCNKETGVCESGGCAAGWQNLNCSTPCAPGTFGMNCSSPCRCLNSSEFCDHATGRCVDSLCVEGYQGNNCSLQCDSGAFGINCSHECHCLTNVACHHIDGVCGDGLCEAGFRGDNCSLPCSKGFYGLNCSEACGYCANNHSCNTRTGQCEYGCDSKHKGPKCDALTESRDGGSSDMGLFTLLGAVIAFAAVLVLVVLLAVFIRRRRSSNSSEKPSQSEGENILKEKGNKCQKDVSETCLYQNEDTNNRVSSAEYYSFFPRQTDLQVHHLWDYINDHKNDDYFENEFKSLQKGLTRPCETARRPENYNKNRYKDVYAYDQTRIVLSDKDKNDSDYINACVVNGYEKVKKFIAAQGPTEYTVNDFWQMVWQERVSTIVMLTNLIEMGNLKCMQYWPDDDKMTYGSYMISVRKTIDCKDYVVRDMQLEKTADETRLVRQFHFKAWPDKTVPDAAFSFVQFWRDVTGCDAGDFGPIVVHCSAGVGRTGTFIALDNLYHQAVSEGCLRPLQMVEAIRRQRVNMIQTKDQYVFLHEAVAEAFYYGTHCVFANEFQEYYTFMCEKAENTGTNRLQMQYELLQKSLKCQSNRTLDNQNIVTSDAIYSNAIEEGLPQCDSAHTIVSEDGGKYETIELLAFNRPRSVLVCRTPTDEDHDRYLQIIKNKGIKTIVALSGHKDAQLKDVELPDHVKQLPCTSDLNHPQPKDMESFVHFVNSVQDWQPSINDSQPILIHSQSDLSQCLIVCIVLGEAQRIKLDGAVNVLAATKMALTNHPELIPTVEQYRFCHEVLLQLTIQPDVYANV